MERPSAPPRLPVVAAALVFWMHYVNGGGEGRIHEIKARKERGVRVSGYTDGVGVVSGSLGELEGQREALHAALQAQGPRLQAVDGRHLVLVAEPRPGHQGPRA
ncbi:hypothetical protein CRUP_028981 [Coryphaenoides rupestris]|nr:hypothetical protein CRUP_028981 [Coryphaenoides rupestris]